MFIWKSKIELFQGTFGLDCLGECLEFPVVIVVESLTRRQKLFCE